MPVIYLFVSLALIPAPSFAARMDLYFSTEESPELKANIYITDPQGVREGYLEDGTPTDTKLGIGYAIDRIDDDETGDLGNAVLVMNISPVKVGAYTITVHGITDTEYTLDIYHQLDLQSHETKSGYSAFITSGATHAYGMSIADPAIPPTLSKTVTFQILFDDILVARKKNQLGDDKFAASLVKSVNLAEKLFAVCDKRKARKDKCEPAVNVLKLFVKRLDLANRKCDNPASCDEEREWAAFRKEHGRDDDYKDFFRDWDRDDWHKWKKKCKRFVGDEALKIIKEDAQWLIKSLGGEIDRKRDNHAGGKEKE